MGWRKIHNRLCFCLLVVKFAIDGFCITHDPKEIKKKPFQSVMRYLRGWKAREELNKGRLGSGLKQF